MAYIGVQTEVLDDAEVLLENAVQFEPDNDLARFDYMGVLYRRQKYAASFAQAEQLIEKAPDNVRHQTAYANQCVAIGRFDEAIAIYDQVIPKVPDPALVHLLKAHALKTIDQTEQAIKAYRAAYENKPGFGDAFWSLANLKTYRFTALRSRRCWPRLPNRTCHPLIMFISILRWENTLKTLKTLNKRLAFISKAIP